MTSSQTIPPTRIRVRVFRDADSAQVREIFRLGIGYGARSARAAMLRGSLTRMSSISSYCAFITGLLLLQSPRLPYKVLGNLLSITSLAFFFLHRRQLNKFALSHAETAHADLVDTFRHYQLLVNADGSSTPSGQSGFWVAEAVKEGEKEGEIVGCVGLDITAGPEPNSAELRRMAVSSSFQRRGIGGLLIQTALDHARKHGLASVYLTTTGYQASAVGIYQKFGWKKIPRRSNPWYDVRLEDFRLDLTS